MPGAAHAYTPDVETYRNRSMIRRTIFTIPGLLLLCFSAGGFSQEETYVNPQQKLKRPYEQVVTPDFASQEGVFRVHLKGERLLFEIPTAMLGKEFVIDVEIQRAPNGGYGGTAIGDRVVRWVRRGDKVLLRCVNYSIRASEGDAAKVAVEAANVEPIIAVFDIETVASDGGLVVDVTKLFKTDVPEFSVRATVGGTSLDT